MSRPTPPPWRWEKNETGQAVRLVPIAEGVERPVLYISPAYANGGRQERFLVASPADLLLIQQAPMLMEAKDRALELLLPQLRNITPSLLALREAADILRRYGA